jgi:hypothetical protein
MKKNVNFNKMNHIRFQLSIILPLAFICLFACTNNNTQITKTLLEQQFTQIFKTDARVEYVGEEFFIDDLTGDGISDGLVTYTKVPTYEFGGGNWSSTGTVIFCIIAGEVRYFDVDFPDIGSLRGFGSYKVTGVSDGIIYVTALSYRDEDPLCCPTIETKHKFKLIYELMEKYLVEI